MVTIVPHNNETNEACPAGRYLADNAKSAVYHESIEDCFACEVGKFSSDSEGVMSCTECPAGRNGNSAGLTACAKCAAGKAQPGTGQSACVACAAGFVMDAAGALVCRACDAGKHASGTGNVECIGCKPGKFSAATGSSECTDCPEGTRSSEYTQSSTCTTCVSPTTTRGDGAVNCSACESGYYWDRGGCTKCPEGTTCSSSSNSSGGGASAYSELETLNVDEFYFRFSRTATTVYECKALNSGKQCRGGSLAGL